MREGEILGFAGLAGAGRTELMQSLCGITGKAAGKVYLDEREITCKNYLDAMEKGIVYVSEDRGKYGLIMDMSIEQNISLPQIDKLKNAFGKLNVKKEKGDRRKIHKRYAY